MGIGSRNRRSVMDWVGITLSGLCLAHCLLLPPLLAILPLLTLSPLPDWLHETEWFHAALLVPVFLVSGPTLLRGAHRDRRIGWWAIIAFALLVCALFMPSEAGEQALTVLGASVLVMAHWRNRKLQRYF